MFSSKTMFAGLCVVLLSTSLAKAQGNTAYIPAPSQPNATLTVEGLHSYLRTIDPNLKRVQRDQATVFELNIFDNNRNVPVNIEWRGGSVFYLGGMQVYSSMSQITPEMGMRLLLAQSKTSPTHYQLVTLPDNRVLVRAGLRLEQNVTMATFASELRYFLGDLNTGMIALTGQGNPSNGGFQASNPPAPAPAPNNNPPAFQGPSGSPVQNTNAPNPLAPLFNSNGTPTYPVR